jgi:CRP-like cAMP-binding protein
VNWRATRIRTFNNNIVVIPNSVMSRERLEIFPRRNANARLVSVSASYDVPPAKVIRVLEQAAANVEHVATDMPCIARVASFADFAIHYDIKYFTREYHMRDTIDAEVRRAVWYALKRNAIPIPLPIRSVHRYVPPPTEHATTLDQVAERLAAADILAPLSDAERRKIAEGTRVSAYSRGETILAYGQAGDSMYVIHEGSVSVRIPSGDTFTEVAQLGPGSIFGEMALLTGESRTASIVAVTDVIAMKIQKSVMQPLLHDNPDLVSALSDKIMERRAAAATAASSEEEDHRSLLHRIRSYFGLLR